MTQARIRADDKKHIGVARHCRTQISLSVISVPGLGQQLVVASPYQAGHRCIRGVKARAADNSVNRIFGIVHCYNTVRPNFFDARSYYIYIWFSY